MTVRDTLFGALRDRAHPVLVFPDQVIPAASLWVVMRLWLDTFRAAKLVEGAALAFAPACNPAGIGALLAAAWENLAVVLPDHPAFGSLDARCEPRGMFDAADDRLAPRPSSSAQPGSSAQPADITLEPGVHAVGEHIPWRQLFGAALPADTVELQCATWTAPSSLRDLGRALVGAEIVRFH